MIFDSNRGWYDGVINPDEVGDSKEDAIAKGLTKYLGSPCKKHGHRVRRVSSGECFICNRRRSNRTLYQKREGISRMPAIDALKFEKELENHLKEVWDE
jgi:hypothetical protein